MNIIATFSQYALLTLLVTTTLILLYVGFQQYKIAPSNIQCFRLITLAFAFVTALLVGVTTTSDDFVFAVLTLAVMSVASSRLISRNKLFLGIFLAASTYLLFTFSQTIHHMYDDETTLLSWWFSPAIFYLTSYINFSTLSVKIANLPRVVESKITGKSVVALHHENSEELPERQQQQTC